jgi:hypothetical protein
MSFESLQELLVELNAHEAKFRAGADEPDYELLIRAIREAVEEIIRIRGVTLMIEGVPPDEIPG